MVQIESTGMELTPSILNMIHKKVEAIRKIEPRISSFHAHLRTPKKRKPNDRVLKLQVHIPQKEVVVEESGKDLYRAINQAFQKVKQKIVHYHQRRGDAKVSTVDSIRYRSRNGK